MQIINDNNDIKNNLMINKIPINDIILIYKNTKPFIQKNLTINDIKNYIITYIFIIMIINLKIIHLLNI